MAPPSSDGTSLEVEVAASEVEDDDPLALLGVNDERLEAEACGIHDDFGAVHARECLELEEPATLDPGRWPRGRLHSS